MVAYNGIYGQNQEAQTQTFYEESVSMLQNTNLCILGYI